MKLAVVDYRKIMTIEADKMGGERRLSSMPAGTFQNQ